MKVIILLGGLGRRLRPLTWSRPKALLHVAGSTVLGHILHSLGDLLNEEVIFVIGPKGDSIKEWVSGHHPDLNSHFVTQPEPLGTIHAIWCCRDYLRDERQLLLALGNSIVEAKYAGISAIADDKRADAVFLVKEMTEPHPFRVAVQDDSGFVSQLAVSSESSKYREALVGVNWFRNSRHLLDAVEHAIQASNVTLSESSPIHAQQNDINQDDVFQLVLDAGIPTITAKVYQRSGVEEPDSLLATNARLLSIGLHSADAIERSYAEDFTVLPPVYLHPEAKVSNAVIGPYASIAAHAIVSNALVRNSIIDAGATIANCVLDGALVGEGSQVTGRAKGPLLGDYSNVEL